jgi:hypothetical protein
MIVLKKNLKLKLTLFRKPNDCDDASDTNLELSKSTRQNKYSRPNMGMEKKTSYDIELSSALTGVVRSVIN